MIDTETTVDATQRLTFGVYRSLVLSADGYPAGCERSNFKFITRFESNREKWGTMEGINLCDGQHYRMALAPNGKQDRAVPESLRIILRLYLSRAESKSLALDGTPCTADTQGLLRRASVVADEIVPVGKETDRQWEHGEDMSLLDFQVLEYREAGRPAIADAALIEQMTKVSIKEIVRRTKIDRNTIRRVLRCQSVRRATLALLKKSA